MMTLSEPPPLDDSSRLREYLSVLRVRKWTVIRTSLFALLGAAFYVQRTEPTYTSTVKVQVTNPLAFLPGTTNQTSAPNRQTEATLVASTTVVACAQQLYDLSTGGAVVAPSPSPPPPRKPGPTRNTTPTP